MATKTHSPENPNAELLQTAPAAVATHAPSQGDLLRSAASGDAAAARSVCQYLSSTNPDLTHIMQHAIHSAGEEAIWRWLMDHATSQVETSTRLSRTEKAARQRCFQSIAEVFVVDHTPDEKAMKQSVLRQALVARSPAPDKPHGLTPLVNCAAYLLALRGHAEVIPVLEDMIDHASLTWKLYAVQALESLHDARCGPALLKALASPPAELHRNASRALNELGPLARQTWIDALHHPEQHIRWHAARGLGQVGDPAGLEILAEGLADESQAVRWTTANVLAALDSLAIPAILKELTTQPLNEAFRQAAYHALHAMPSANTQAYLQPLLKALNGRAFVVEAPSIAQGMLAGWRNHTGVTTGSP